MTERREVVVGSVLQRHQLRQWLNVSRISYDESLGDAPGETIVHITATPEQFLAVDQWLQRIGVQS